MNLRSEVLILAKKLCLYKIFPLLSEAAQLFAAGSLTSPGRPDRKKYPQSLPVVTRIPGELSTGISTFDENQTGTA
jgi:hypothetical protein